MAPAIRGMDRAVAGADALAMARSLGATLLVTGVVLQAGDSVQARADILDVASGQVVRSVGPESGPLARPGAALDALRERLVGTIALLVHPVLNDVIPSSAAQTPTYAAFREFSAGEEVARVGRWADAFVNYAEAYRLDSTFTFAAVRTARGFYHTQRCDKADALAASLTSRRDRLSEYERAVLDRTTARCRGDWVAAFDAARRMMTLAPGSVESQYVYGVSALYLYRAEEGLRNIRGAEVTSSLFASSPALLYNVALALHLLGRHAEERRFADSAAATFPGAPTYGIVLDATAAMGDTAAAEQLAMQITSLPMSSDIDPPLLLTATADELRRHGHPLAARRVATQLGQYLDDLPAGRRDHTYWLHRARTHYALAQWPAAAAAVDSAEQRHRALPTGRRTTADADEILALRGRVAARQGDTVKARAIQRTLLARSGPYLRGVTTRYAAEIAGAIGQRDEAIRLLRQSIQQGQHSVDRFLDALPDFDAFKDDPAFLALFAPRG